MATQSAIPFGYFPDKGRDEQEARCLSIVVNFSLGASQQTMQPLDQSGLCTLQALYIDNSGSTAPTTIMFGGSRQSITCPPQSQGYFRVLGSNAMLDFTATNSSGAIVPLIFINVELPSYGVWGIAQNYTGTTGTQVGAASLATSQATIGVVAALVVAARSGAQGVGRAAVTLYNTGAATVYYGPTAGVTTANGMPLPAGAAVTLNTMAAIYGISPGAGNVIGITETY